MSAIPTAKCYQVPQAQHASADTVLGATERLSRSRQIMRDQMLDLKAGRAQAQAGQSRQHSALLATLTAMPLLGPLVDRAVAWWAEHPLRPVAELFGSPDPSADEPLTQRHPWAMLLGAAAIGALLMWTRPWRFAPLRRAVCASLLPQMVTRLLSRKSTDGLLDLVTSVLRPAAKPSPPADAKQSRH
ncbi:MAG: hypothetical protein WCJ87_04885 [Burkholderiales bacterium]